MATAPVQSLPSRKTRPARQDSTGKRPRAAATGPVDLVGLYLRDIGRIPMLTDEQFDEMAERIETLRATGDVDRLRAAYRELVEANLRLVVSIAKHYTKFGVPLTDLIQAGNLGLMTAVERFDFTRGLRLSTYASKWIHAGITRHISNHARNVRVPVNVLPLLRRLDRAEQEFTLRSGQKPTISDLAACTGMRERRVRDLLGVPEQTLSLDHPIRSTDSQVTLTDVIADPSAADSRDVLEERMALGRLRQALKDNLDAREREVLRLRYGLDGEDALTQAEIGQRLRVSRQRISQIESRALDRLRAQDDGVLEAFVS